MSITARTDHLREAVSPLKTGKADSSHCMGSIQSSWREHRVKWVQDCEESALCEVRRLSSSVMSESGNDMKSKLTRMPLP